MTIYVFDTSPLVDIFRHYYRERFPTFWSKFDAIITEERTTSTREVQRELQGREDSAAQWSRHNIAIFPTPSEAEAIFVREIFAIPHFQQNISEKERKQGRPVADPFVIARAKCLRDNRLDTYVVTSEKLKENAARIPNICEHFGIPWVNLEEFMQRERWKF